MFLVTAVVDVVMKSLLLERLLVMARYIESYRISRYWRHIESYPYRDNYRSNEFDIPHYSRKSRCRQQTTRIANRYRHHQQRERRTGRKQLPSHSKTGGYI